MTFNAASSSRPKGVMAEAKRHGYKMSVLARYFSPCNNGVVPIVMLRLYLGSGIVLYRDVVRGEAAAIEGRNKSHRVIIRASRKI